MSSMSARLTNAVRRKCQQMNASAQTKNIDDRIAEALRKLGLREMEGSGQFEDVELDGTVYRIEVDAPPPED